MSVPDGTNNSQDSQLFEEWLAAHTDALLAGLENSSLQFTSMAPPQVAEANELLGLVRQLRDSLTPTAPSEEFSRRLKNELMGVQPVTLVVRWRKLPPHYQLAAKLGGLTLTAGILLLATRRALGVLDALHHREQPEADQGLTLNTASS